VDYPPEKVASGITHGPQYSGEENVSSHLSGDFNTYVVRDSAQTLFTLRKLRQFNFFQEGHLELLVHIRSFAKQRRLFLRRLNMGYTDNPQT
jgi:hypothetical protein